MKKSAKFEHCSMGFRKTHNFILIFSFSGSGAEKRVEHYIKRISPEAMKIIIMIFNKDLGVDDDSLAKLTKAFKTALITAAKKQFAMSDDDLKQSIDNIPCILLEYLHYINCNIDLSSTVNNKGIGGWPP